MLYECLQKKVGKPKVEQEDQKEKSNNVHDKDVDKVFAFLTCAFINKDSKQWIIDTAASNHYTSDETNIDSGLKKFEVSSVSTAGDEKLPKEGHESQLRKNENSARNRQTPIVGRTTHR